MAATAQMVKELRDRTGAGVMDCKEALQAARDDLEAAVEFLRKKGLAQARCQTKSLKRSKKSAAVGPWLPSRKSRLTFPNLPSAKRSKFWSNARRIQRTRIFSRRGREEVLSRMADELGGAESI